MNNGRLRPKQFGLPLSRLQNQELGNRVWGIPVLAGIGVGVVAAYFTSCEDPDFCGMKKGLYGVLSFFPGMLLGHVIEEATR